MVMFRISFLFVVTMVFSLGEGYAVRKGNNNDENLLGKSHPQYKTKDRKREISVQNSDLTSAPTKKTKFNNPIRFNATEKENVDEIKIDPNFSLEKLSIFSPLLKYSPMTAERKFLSPMRKGIVKKQHRKGIHKKCHVSAAEVGKIFKDNDQGNYWTGISEVDGRKIAEADFLFSPTAEVLTKAGWKTNLELMEKGDCPIAHKGIVAKEQRTSFQPRVIKRLQKRYRLELHHVTQENTGKICELTHAAHMGKNANVIVEPLPDEDERIRIVHSSLEKKEALALFKKGQILVTNVLHPKRGSSTINRKKFALLKKNHWRNRAYGIKKGKFRGKNNLTTHVVSNKLYTSPLK